MPRAPHQLKSSPVLTPHTSSGQMTWKLKGTDPSVTLGGQLLSRPLLLLHCSVMNITVSSRCPCRFHNNKKNKKKEGAHHWPEAHATTTAWCSHTGGPLQAMALQHEREEGQKNLKSYWPLAQGEFNPRSPTIEQAYASLAEPCRNTTFFCSGFVQLMWESAPKSITVCFSLCLRFHSLISSLAYTEPQKNKQWPPASPLLPPRER